MAAAAPPKLGLHNQDRVVTHRMLSEDTGGAKYYIGSNGVCFRVVRTLAQALAGHVLLVNLVRPVTRPDGSRGFEDLGEQRAIKRLVKYNLEHKIR